MKQTMMKKTFTVLSFALAVLLLVTTVTVFAEPETPEPWDGSVADSFAFGTGTETDPYLIENVSQLAYLSVLTNDGIGFADTEEERINAKNQGLTHIYTGTADSGLLSYTYHISAYEGKEYLTSSAAPTSSFVLTGASVAVTYYRYVIGDTDYYTLGVPTATSAQSAFRFNADECKMERIADTTISYQKPKVNGKYINQYFVTGTPDTYATGYTACVGHEVSFNEVSGTAKQMVFLSSSVHFTHTEYDLLSIAIKGHLYTWFKDGTVAPRVSADTVTVAENGNVTMAYGTEEALSVIPYAALSYRLTADLCINDTEHLDIFDTVGADNAWTPIGYSPLSPFIGTFDGGNHTVSGLYFKNDLTKEYSGLFGYLKNASACNLNLKEGYIKAKLSIGAFAGMADNSTISGIQNESVEVCTEKGRDSVADKHPTLHTYAGGILGMVKGETKVFDCLNLAPVTAWNNSNSSTSGCLDGYAGGIVGYAMGTASEICLVTDCQNEGVVLCKIAHSYRNASSGGIVGVANYALITGCKNTGNVEINSPGNGNLGGIVGSTTNSSVLSCIADSMVNNTYEKAINAGGIAGLATGAKLYNNIFIGTVTNSYLVDGVQTVYPNTGILVGNTASKTEVKYNFYIDNHEETISTAILTSGCTEAQNNPVTAEQLAGTSADVISTDGTYANTPSVTQAMNQFVLAYNQKNGVTLTQGETLPEVYNTYNAIYQISVTGNENGVCDIENEKLIQFPDDFIGTGYGLGETISFTVSANTGYVVREVNYAYGGNTAVLTPNALGKYEFVMPEADVTITLSLVPSGDGVYNIIYTQCDEVSVWSAYQIKAHFAGYDTVIPTPTRPGYHFKGWLVNDATEPVMELTLDANAYSADITLEATWEAKSIVDLLTEIQSYIYQGNACPFVVSGPSASLSGISVAYYVGDEWTKSAPVNAGDYDVRLVRAEDNEYQLLDIILPDGLHIERADSSITIKEDISTEYHNAIVSDPLYDFVGDGVLSVTYYDALGNLLESAPKNTGDYRVKVAITQGTNYKAAEQTVTFSIAKATLDTNTFSWTYTEPFTYDTAEHTVTLQGVPTDISVIYSGVRKAIKAGEYTVSVSFEFDSENYNDFTYAPLNWEIEKAVIDDTTLCWVYDDYIYDGTEKNVTVSGIPSDVTVSGYTGNAATNAGSYTASVTFLYDTGNYESVSITPLVWSIEKATYPISGIAWSETELVFNGQLQSVILTNVPSGLRVEYSGNSYVTCGSYTATAVFFGDAENYHPVRTLALEWEIERADAEFIGDMETLVIYDGQPHLPMIALNHNEATISYDLEPKTELGQYWFTLSVPETMNYNAKVAIFSLKITLTDAELLAKTNEYNQQARNASSMCDMYRKMSLAYEMLMMISDKSAEGVNEAYNQLLLTASAYNAHVADTRPELVGANKMLGAMLYQQHPIPSVKAVISNIVNDLQKEGE